MIREMQALRDHSTLLLAALVLAAGCDDPTPPPSEDIVAEPEPPAATPRPAPAAHLPTGRWTSDGLCLEVFGSGELELSFQARPPKVLVMGVATTELDGETMVARFEVGRIWRARYSTACRTEHHFGQFAEEHGGLGVLFVPGETVALRLTRRGTDELELCAEECVTLTRDERVLRGRWRAADYHRPVEPARPLVPGEVLEFAFGVTAHIWLVATPSTHRSILVDAEVQLGAGDTFAVTLTPREAAENMLGAPIAQGVARAFQVQRQGGQRIEVCSGAHCSTLEREFDSSAHHLP